jgi:hypothetical protein
MLRKPNIIISISLPMTVQSDKVRVRRMLIAYSLLLILKNVRRRNFITMVILITPYYFIPL